jgi:CubicO group peptidase (beta-lactamase class C family)
MSRSGTGLLAGVLVAPFLAWTLHAQSVPTAAKPEDVGLSAARLTVITTTMQRHIDDADVAGVVTLVARRGRVAHLEALGMKNIAAKAPMTTDAIFRLASMSKPITGVAVMMLVEEGTIALADPVSRFIPEFAGSKVAVARPGGGGRGRGAGAGSEPAYDVVSATRAITIGDLLMHTSGLVSGGLGAAAAPPVSDTDTLVTHIPKLGAVPLDFQPGTLWRYSGQAGFNVLSRVVEVVSGQTFDVFLKERLFDPLGMTSTGFVPPPGGEARIPVLYQRNASGLQPTNTPTSTKYFAGASALMSSATDYLQFAQMLLNGGELNGRRYLSPRTVSLMIANHTGDMVNGQFGRPARGMGFGLSMQVVQDPVAADLRVSKGAYGWAGGTGVSFWIEPEEEMVSIFMIQGAGGGVRQSFENAVRQAIID